MMGYGDSSIITFRQLAESLLPVIIIDLSKSLLLVTLSSFDLGSQGRPNRGAHACLRSRYIPARALDHCKVPIRQGLLNDLINFRDVIVETPDHTVCGALVEEQHLNRLQFASVVEDMSQPSESCHSLMHGEVVGALVGNIQFGVPQPEKEVAFLHVAEVLERTPDHVVWFVATETWQTRIVSYSISMQSG
ncbi:hypothetical protein EJ03DRAFT_136129 [Teratosphaeria nubilosa]|uniref:Uncharacterized protein n=1 Tax=Teratosphaeria nubilosa TaxID=161662 RepID=A0A6G1L654_9PEZI|nr:hypothetical protein EJ03DRAFT_136129 [Teratosphaeria nubilosa]